MTTLLTVGIVLVSLALSAALGAAVVSWVLKRIGSDGAEAGVLRGGMWIGVLERLAITGGLLVGMPEVVAVVIAIKGLGRYPELRNSDHEHRGRAAERFIIGTLSSFLWAGVVGVAAYEVLVRYV